MITRIIILSSLMFLTLLPVNAQNKGELSDAEKIYGLSLLWKEASYNFAYFDQVPSINWDKAYLEYIFKVQETESIVEYYNVLKQFLALLRDGHTRIMPPDVYREYYDEPKIKLVNIQNKAIVQNVGISLINEIPIGSSITKINDIPINDYLAIKKFPYISCTPEHILWTIGIMELLREEKGTIINITYVTPKGVEREITLKCNSKEIDEDWSVPGPDDTKRLVYKKLENDISYLALHTYNDRKIIDDFKAVIPEIQKSKGVIINIRKDQGGDSEIGYTILKHFIYKPIITERWKTRELRSVYKAWGKWTSELSSDALKNISEERKLFLKHYKGTAWFYNTPDTIYPAKDERINLPVIVLAGNMTASAAEDFLIGTSSINDVVFIGERTAGFPGIPLFMELPGGGFALITTTKEVYENGSDDINKRKGIEPDLEIQPTIQDIIENRDPALKKGIEILADKIR